MGGRAVRRKWRVRIGVITTSYPRFAEDPAGGFVRGLNRYLVQKGHTVEVLAAGEATSESAAKGTQQADWERAAKGAQQADWERAGEDAYRVDGADAPVDADGISVVRLPSRLFYRGGAPDALGEGGVATVAAAVDFQVRLLAACGRRIRRYDALISHWLVPCGVAAALCAGRRPHVAIAHSSDVHLLRRLRLTGLGRWLSRRSRLVYTSASLQLPGAPGHVVPMGVTVAEFAATAAERSAARHALGLTRPTVLALCRLVPVKGLAGLLTAMAALDGAELLIAGDGPLRAELERQAAPLGARVRFLGEVRGPARVRLLQACDALVLPSLILPDGRTESAPTVLLEALAAGCPIVATAVGGVTELVGDAGLIVPPADPVALTAALRHALFTPGWAAACTARAHRRAAQFDWDTLAPRLLGPHIK